MALTLDLTPSILKRVPSSLQKKLNEIQTKPLPAFVTHEPDIYGIRAFVQPYHDYQTLLLLGNGGSINNFIALYEALTAWHNNGKQVIIVNTNEPEFITKIKKRFSNKDSLVMMISKSGENLVPLEALFAFQDYHWVGVTQEKSTVAQLAKHSGVPVYIHPDVGGRYAGRTSCSFVPLAFFNLDIEQINEGALALYKKSHPSVPLTENKALQLSLYLLMLEEQGYGEVFMSFYTTALTGFLPLIVQLMHESVAKQEKGQTFFGGLAPETHHHTNQRFFGGPKNVVGLFVRVARHQHLTLTVPQHLRKLPFRKGTLGDLHHLELGAALLYEYEGTRQHALKKKIPHAVLTLDAVTPYTVGELLAFFQYVAVYSSWLRDVNPFDQPEVEFAKSVSFRLIQHAAQEKSLPQKQ
ncbi:hypothetical protein HYW21_07010 [Candidatus Woesearchaeota archaeon]|nr:hypothetical protein [Candidatus Woesearchaeota archaeon]